MKRHHLTKRIALILFFVIVPAIMILCFSSIVFAVGEMPDSGLPVVYIDIDESQGTIDDMIASPDHSAYCYGTLSIEVPEGFHYCDYPELDLKSYENLKMSIRGRGNSTWNQKEKKPFKIKLDRKEDIFGFGRNKHWVLLANAFDPTLMRNRITYWLAGTLGFEFTPEGVPVDLVIRGDQYGTKYLGSYWLGENIRVDENRLDIGELGEEDTKLPDITGGYLIQNALQVEEGSASRFNTVRGEPWANDTPSFDTDEGGYENEAQKNYIRNHINTVEDAIYAGEESYRDLLDVESAADYWLINTLAMNLDAYKTSSTYIYKKRDENGVGGKVYWGPVWDFDYAWDQGETYEGMTPGHTWMKPLFADRTAGGFIETVLTGWPSLKENAEYLIAEGGLIDQYFEETKRSAEQDHLINPDEGDTEYSYKEKTENLKTWIRNRIDWLDANIGTIGELVHTITYKADGKTVGKDYCETGETVLIQLEQPEKDGFIFMGWQDEEGNLFEFDVTADHDLELNAEFIPESEAVQGRDIVFAKSSDIVKYDPENTVYMMDWAVIPYDTYDKWIDWSISDESIASISEDGQVIIHAPGTVIVTAVLHNGIRRDFTLTVTEDEIPLPEKIIPENEVIRMTAGEVTNISMYTEPANSKVGEYQYESENPEIVTVDFYGVITALSQGTARIHIQSSTDTEDEPHICDAWVTVAVSDAAQPAYTVVSGSEAEWIKGSREGITIIVKRNSEDESCFTHFRRVQMDGRDLIKDIDYTVKAGSTAVTLNQGYLETLAEGEHEVMILFDDGSAETKLIVKNTSRPTPDTGDHSSPGIWFLLLVISLSGALCAGLKRKNAF